MNAPRRTTIGLLVALITAPGLLAQAPAPTEPDASAEEEDIIQLSPFEVRAESDQGYVATQTLAGTRIRTDLADVGSAISVVTREFLQDVGATDNSTLLQYTTNSEVAGTRGTYSGLGNGSTVDETANLRSPGGVTNRVRGLAQADNTRDFFVTDIPWDSYNVDRVDIQRGPNSILFGLGSPAGIVNASTRNAEFRNLGSVEVRFGSYGTRRGSIDINQELIDNVLAIRVDALWNDEKFRQEPAFQEDKRYYGALRFDPQIFDRRDFHTSFRAKYEHGEIDANRPRIVPPRDSISPWFRPVDATSLDGGMGKLSINNAYEIGSAPTTTSPWLTGDAIANQQQPIWFIDGETNQQQRIYGGFVNTGARESTGAIRGSGQNLIGQRYATMFFGLTDLSAYATNARLPNSQFGQYRDMSLRDPSVFDFYNNLIDGPTKSEFEKWDAYNLTFTQTGWNDRAGLELNYDRQKYKRGGQSLLGNPTINIDILRNFQDRPDVAATAAPTNPNFGRPYIVGGPGRGNSYESDREYLRGSLFGEVRSSDFFDRDSFLAKLLGKHRFNGVYSSEEYTTENRNWQMYGHTRDWAGYWNRTDGSSSSISEDRPPVAIIYLGSSLGNASSAAGANISRIDAPVSLREGNLYYFDATWNNQPGVAFDAPWTVPANLAPAFNPDALPTGQTGFLQNSNPANYVGWNTNRPMNLLRYNDGEDLSLLTNAQMSQRETTSYAVSWQGFLWNDAIVPTLGWRYDEVKGRGVTAPRVSTNRGIPNLASDVYRLPAEYPSNQIFKDHSTSGGIVVHLNKLVERDPLPINVSLSYNKSDNFQVTDVRRDIYGTPIANPTGSTKDYGVLLSTKDNKFSLRALKYETTVSNASTQSDIVQLVGNPVQQGLRFRNVFLYRLANYPWDSREQPQQRNTWTPAYVDANGRAVADFNGVPEPIPAGATLQTQAQADSMRDASIRAWNDIQKWLEGKGYFQYWGYTPTTSSALTDRATYEANPGAFMPDPATVFAYGYTQPSPQGLTLTADTLSEGYEFEFTANPTRNWRVAFNAARTEAVRNNVGGGLLDEFITFMDEQMAGPAGDMRQFNGDFVPNNQLRQNWANQRARYTLLKLQEGSAAPEIREWRYNLVTNYSFSEGRLKGFGVGGSYRWQDKVVIGYPVTSGAGGQASFDLSKPYYGPSEDAIDLWASYERKLTDKITWRIQLNVRNAFADDGLIPISVQPDGQTWAAVRVKPAQEWFVSNTFSF